LRTLPTPYPATIVYPSGAVDTTALPQGEQDRLDALMRIVGGHLQAIPLPDARYMLVDEDGKSSAHALNQTATDIAHDAESISRQDYIAGVAVIVPQEALN